MWRGIIIGIRRNFLKFIFEIAFGYVVLWKAIGPIFSIFSIKTEKYSWYCFVIYFILSVIIAIIRVFPKRSIKFDFKNTNTKIEIEFGNLFTQKGHKVISSNDYFDTKIGVPVSEKSLLGVFIKTILGGHPEIIDTAVNTQLVGQEIGVVQKIDGKNKKYEIGTTISITHHDNSLYFLFALANADYECKTSTTPSLMLKALDGLWNRIRLEGNGSEINIPLIGNGLSRVGLPPTQLLQLILISLLKSAKESDLSSTIRIVLTQDMFDKVDLESVKNNWQ